jgi:hypothetical protein
LDEGGEGDELEVEGEVELGEDSVSMFIWYELRG